MSLKSLDKTIKKNKQMWIFQVLVFSFWHSKHKTAFEYSPLSLCLLMQAHNMFFLG